MNCAEPANTASDISAPCQAASGPPPTSVPKITPNGAAPIIIGIVSRAPSSHSLSGRRGGDAGVLFKKRSSMSGRIAGRWRAGLY
uniref:hypothetical protein n=1 Tax=Burkholderia cenocepacia TaxID=95486 RepID=UPI000B044EC0